LQCSSAMNPKLEDLLNHYKPKMKRTVSDQSNQLRQREHQQQHQQQQQQRQHQKQEQQQQQQLHQQQQLYHQEQQQLSQEQYLPQSQQTRRDASWYIPPIDPYHLDSPYSVATSPSYSNFQTVQKQSTGVSETALNGESKPVIICIAEAQVH
ncbi:hypothetical protein PMAYCL1PPCAC_08898, partial [Pristionchus mayeri]